MNHKYIIKLIAILILLSFIPAVPVLAVQLADFAGSGAQDFMDGKCLDAAFIQPYGLALDKDGGLIAVDSVNNRIRKIKDGSVTTIAGFTNRKDSFGLPEGGLADGAALKAKFNKPRCAAVDSKGSIFVTDTGNNMIRRISGGKVYTFAGGKAGFANGKASAAKFNAPSGIAVDGNDNLYIADSLNHCIRKITPKGDVTTFAGKNAEQGSYKDGAALDALFNEPSGLCIAKNGAVYVLDSGNQLVRKIENGMVSTISGSKGALIAGTTYAQGGFRDGSSALYNFPKGITVADNGTIFIADTWNHRIRAIRPDGTVITVAGTGTPGKKNGALSEAMFNGPTGVLFAQGTLYISDMWNNSIRSLPIDLDNLPRVMDRDELMKGISFKPVSDKIQIWVDKIPVNIPDVEPYIEKGRTFVPLRFICEQWGAKVEWLEKTQQVRVTKGSFDKTFTYGKDPVVNNAGRTMVHIRYLAESMGFYVDWAGEYRAVVISTAQ